MAQPIATKNTYDAIYLSNYATINVIDPLARIKGVGQVVLFGPLDGGRFVARAATPEEVMDKLEARAGPEGRTEGRGGRGQA